MITIQGYALDVVRTIPVTEWTISRLDSIYKEQRREADKVMPFSLNTFLLEVGLAYCHLHPNGLFPSQRIPCLIMFTASDRWDADISSTWYDAFHSAGIHVPMSKHEYYRWVGHLYDRRAEAL